MLMVYNQVLSRQVFIGLVLVIALSSRYSDCLCDPDHKFVIRRFFGISRPEDFGPEAMSLDQYYQRDVIEHLLKCSFGFSNEALDKFTMAECCTEVVPNVLQPFGEQTSEEKQDSMEADRIGECRTWASNLRLCLLANYPDHVEEYFQKMSLSTCKPQIPTGSEVLDPHAIDAVPVSVLHSNSVNLAPIPVFQCLGYAMQFILHKGRQILSVSLEFLFLFIAIFALNNGSHLLVELNRQMYLNQRTYVLKPFLERFWSERICIVKGMAKSLFMKSTSQKRRNFMSITSY
ncbi:hypothetical protein RF11_13327 [Thelohanellus kitauei]|uniref:Uncharacterized protein n=1 Tax=Thelohanellus kitauei TaxID=669202 RepID=A0A0C2J9B4_THEKT|nr:hypothetical protein RF11_13327 [Thelohanellus kitauei]